LQVEFHNPELRKLYETGSSRKYRLEEAVCRKFTATVDKFIHAPDIYGLWHLPSLNFERLQGHVNRYSARVDRRYRLELEINWEEPNKKVGVVAIVDLTKHYEG
jgi:proteic killer suppression protein